MTQGLRIYDGAGNLTFDVERITRVIATGSLYVPSRGSASYSWAYAGAAAVMITLGGMVIIASMTDTYFSLYNNSYYSGTTVGFWVVVF